MTSLNLLMTFLTSSSLNWDFTSMRRLTRKLICSKGDLLHLSPGSVRCWSHGLVQRINIFISKGMMWRISTSWSRVERAMFYQNTRTPSTSTLVLVSIMESLTLWAPSFTPSMTSMVGLPTKIFSRGSSVSWLSMSQSHLLFNFQTWTEWNPSLLKHTKSYLITPLQTSKKHSCWDSEPCSYVFKKSKRTSWLTEVPPAQSFMKYRKSQTTWLKSWITSVQRVIATKKASTTTKVTRAWRKRKWNKLTKIQMSHPMSTTVIHQKNRSNKKLNSTTKIKHLRAIQTLTRLPLQLQWPRARPKHFQPLLPPSRKRQAKNLSTQMISIKDEILKRDSVVNSCFQTIHLLLWREWSPYATTTSLIFALTKWSWFKSQLKTK